jgi:hypothetical protein
MAYRNLRCRTRGLIPRKAVLLTGNIIHRNIISVLLISEDYQL